MSHDKSIIKYAQQQQIFQLQNLCIITLLNLKTLQLIHNLFQIYTQNYLNKLVKPQLATQNNITCNIQHYFTTMLKQIHTMIEMLLVLQILTRHYYDS